ncbi:MAG TPA: hypothetical protein VFG69_21555 [Nannocystaceae bacterium]|nr:hypothetical protein [Nannocystaceae bacterium]
MSAANDGIGTPEPGCVAAQILDDSRALVVMPKTDEPALVWVSSEEDPSAPAHAIRIDAATAQEWIEGGLPAWLVALRGRGVAVACPKSAHAGLRERVARLRECVAPRTAEALWDFAEEAELTVVATALAMMRPDQCPGYAELATMVARQPEPNAPFLARLLMALEHL